MMKNKNNSSVFVIANLSTNHEDNVETAKEMIEKACKCGADFVYMELDESTCAFSNADIEHFHAIAKENDGNFTTKSLVGSIRHILPIKRFKESDGESSDNDDQQPADRGSPKVDQLQADGYDRRPRGNDGSGVDLLAKLQEEYPKHQLQFWDFQEKITCLPEIVVAIGIKAISCKFTLDDKRSGFDHGVSICARDFKSMVTNIKTVEAALGTGMKEVLSPSELPCFKKLFKSVVAAQNLERGSILKAEDMKIKVSVMQSMSGFYFPVVIGRELLSEVDEDDPIFASDFDGLKHYSQYMSYANNTPKKSSTSMGVDVELFLGRRLNMKSPCYIIAEIGQNHQGDMMMAKKLIKLAKKCGADCVKFQKTCIEEKFTMLALHRPYDSKNSFGATYGEHKQFLEFTDEQFKELKKYAVKKVGIHFTASAMDPVSLDFLLSLKVPFVKIGSGESGNLPLLEKAAKAKVPLVISTGMQTLTDIRITYHTVSRHHNNFALLHCVSAYPTPADEANLNMIKTLRKNFPDILVGYSGHEVGSCITAASVALGAKIVERHITLDRNMKGSDHICSLDPSQFAKLVRDIRYIEQNLDI